MLIISETVVSNWQTRFLFFLSAGNLSVDNLYTFIVNEFYYTILKKCLPHPLGTESVYNLTLDA